MQAQLPLKALTVHQPFAGWIVTGKKTEEYRSQATRHDGPVWIHAASLERSLPALRTCYPTNWENLATTLPFGTIIGLVDIVDCVENRDDQGSPSYSWKLKNPRQLAEPVACPGQLGLWEVPREIELALADSVKRRGFLSSPVHSNVPGPPASRESPQEHKPVAMSNPHPDDEEEEDQLDELLTRKHSLNGAVLFGLDGRLIEIQAKAMKVLRRPKPWADVTEISGMEPRDSKKVLQRITGAFASLGIENPSVKILANLLPPDYPKFGTWLDLPLAVIMLQAAGILPDLPDHHEGDYILVGELDIQGAVRRVPGILSLAFHAKPGQRLIVPSGNEKECALILAAPGHERCQIHPVSTLDEVVAFFKGTRQLENALQHRIQFEDVIPRAKDFGSITGQEKAKLAALYAAAGGHNLLLIGPPGEGKSLIASAIPGILPRLARPEMVELTKIYSAAGALEKDGVAVTRPPIRVVHSGTPPEALVGGGSKIPHPGEITLAHFGVLFLDELPRFKASTLNGLLQPMEAGEVMISRVGGSLSFPCQFILVAAMNPCPCGYFPNCECSKSAVKKYQAPLSGPLVDRIDLQVELSTVPMNKRFQEGTVPELNKLFRGNVEAARKRQAERFKGTSIRCNAMIPAGPQEVRRYCNFSPAAWTNYETLVRSHKLSMRAMDRLAKVARTVADYTNSDQIQPQAVAGAAEFVIGGMLRE